MKKDNNATNNIESIFLDFGGVIAEEGFREGLMAIAIEEGLEPQGFFESANKAIYETGYVIGKASEKHYWQSLREITGISMRDVDLRARILDRFTLRPLMIQIVCALRTNGLFVSILSDQTNWLDELDARDHFCRFFDAVFNSYYLGKAKSDSSIFSDVATMLGTEHEKCLFIDDNTGNINRANENGFLTILFEGAEPLAESLAFMDLISTGNLKALKK